MKKFRFMNYSIEKRLPIFIFSLLFISLVIFISYSYLTVRKNSLDAGYKRLTTLTLQFSSIFSLQVKNLVSVTHQAAHTNEVIQFLRNPGEKNREALKNFDEIKFRYDTLTQTVQLWSVKGKVLYNTNDTFPSDISPGDSAFAIAASAAQEYAGKLYNIDGKILWPVIISVTEKGHKLGYVVRWRRIHATKQAIQQISFLLGRNANILLGNSDGSVWTNLVTVIPDPRIETRDDNNSMEYLSRRGENVIAEAGPIPGTNWVCVVELNKDLILKDTGIFLKWVIIFGIILLTIGLVFTWILSRNITKPLHELSMAAARIADGNYSSPIELNRSDELGVLADSFNQMSRKIRNSKDELEKKINEVEEKNYLLENSLKEKEILLKEVHHRVKNNLQIISSLLNLQSGNIESPEIKEIFKSSQLRIRSIALIHEKLYKSKNIARINLKEYINELIVYLLNLYNTSSARVRTRLEMDEVTTEIGMTITLGLILSELIINAIKYAFPESRTGDILIALNHQKDHEYVLIVKDNGVGFPEDMDFENAQSLGLSIVKTLLSQINGKAEYRRADGTEVRIYFCIPAQPKEEKFEYFPYSEENENLEPEF